MKDNLVKTAVAITFLFLSSTLVSICSAEDYGISFEILPRPAGNTTYVTNVAIPVYLHEYYEQKSHRLMSSSDFPSFVTPYSLKPIADRLLEICETDGDFTNAVLMLVHQLTYVETIQPKYPVETLVDGKGDCDLFSFTAASIMKAGGFDVVLLYYEEQSHMNLGVYLSNSPVDTRERVYYVTDGGKKYYVAECTGENWKEGWRVGECPDDLREVSAEVISLENVELIEPGQVSASFTVLEPSIILLEVTPTFCFQNGMVSVRGHLNPELENENITLYATINNSPWIVLGTAFTQPGGGFEYLCKAEVSGSYTIRAAWSGNHEFESTVSSMNNVIVIPFFLGLLAGIGILAGVISLFVVFLTRRSQKEARLIDFE